VAVALTAARQPDLYPTPGTGKLPEQLAAIEFEVRLPQ
jgi:hypothetical protein